MISSACPAQLLAAREDLIQSQPGTGDTARKDSESAADNPIQDASGPLLVVDWFSFE